MSQATQATPRTDGRAFGRAVPAAMIGELTDSTPLLATPDRLCSRLADDGYLLLRGVLDVSEVLAARHAVFERLVEVGEIAEPAVDGITTGNSRRAERVDDLGVFWRSVVDTPQLRRVTNGPRLGEVMQNVLGTPVRAMDYIFLRACQPGRATGLHFDFPFFTRVTPRIHTVWVPLGPVPVTDGPVALVEGSRGFADILEDLRDFDIALDNTRRAEVSHDPVGFAEARGCRLLTTDFAAGDILVFDMYTLHGALDNHSPIGRARLSCDVRYQPAAEPQDPRYFGANPGGTFGGGYGELNSARPLTEPWHRR